MIELRNQDSKHSILKIITNHPLYFLVSLAFFISSIGTAFTSVAVYFLLEQYQSSSIVFASVFIAGTLPGFITSLWSGRVVHRKNLFYSVFCCQVIATIALIIPLTGMRLHRVDLLITAEVIACASTGILLPFIKNLEKSTFKNKHLEFLAAYDTYFFTFSFILGQGLATILLTFMSTYAFLLIDLCTYIASCSLLFSLRKSFKKCHLESHQNKSNSQQLRLTVLSKTQKNVLIMFIWIALTCSAPMALLPSIGQQFTAVNLLGLSPTLMLLCSRTIGQMFAPILATMLGIEKISRSRLLLVIMLLSYLMCYAGAFAQSSLLLSCILVITAHFCSNIVFTTAQYRLLKEFSVKTIGWAAAFNYRAMTLSTVTITFIAGYWIELFDIPSLFLLLLMVFIIGFLIITWPWSFLIKLRSYHHD